MKELIPNSCEEIATQYAGRYIETTGLYDRDVRIIGYYKHNQIEYVVAEIPNNEKASYKFTGNEENIFSGYLFKTAERLLPKYTLHYFSAKAVKSIIPLPKPFSLYTNKCKLCSSPARNNKATTLCSNVKCKSWLKIRVMAGKLKPKTKYRYTVCHICGEIANEGSKVDYNKIEARCNNGHRWEVNDAFGVVVKQPPSDIYVWLGYWDRAKEEDVS